MSTNQQSLVTALVMSMSGIIANKVKFSCLYARKNKIFGQNLTPTIDLIFEQLIPHYCKQNIDNLEAINNLHNLVFLLAHKSQQVFTSHIIHTAIDQNWDMKGLKAVLLRILKTLDVTGFDLLTTTLDAQIKNQNLQSSSCIKAINSFVRNTKKTINQDDLANSISTYETDFAFIKEDIEKYRAQRIKHECFSVLHPWAYDLDQVDFKYIINNNINEKIMKSLSTIEARVFWLSHFKCQSSVSADDFFQALRESWETCKAHNSYSDLLSVYKTAAAQADYVFSITANDAEIVEFVGHVSVNNQTFNTVSTQVKTYSGDYKGTQWIKNLSAGFSLENQPQFSKFADLPQLQDLHFKELSQAERVAPSDMQRQPFECVPNKAATHKLNLLFEAVDTEEIKNLAISFDGNSGIFKIGEGDANHYQIPNDKKLWESQLMIVCKDGKYFVRDLGIVHTSRIKIDKNTEVQIQQDMLVDLGKVVHYHFNKVTHKQTPNQTASQNFQILFSGAHASYSVEEDDEPPALRARPTWVSSDENKDLIQKEILLEAYSQNYFSIGRSMKREVQIKLKAVSADHCAISYDGVKGWAISEKGKDKLSSNGTFVFMKSHVQMTEHEPSDLIPLHDGMVLSFINYEIRVNLEKKDGDALTKESQDITTANKQLAENAASFRQTLKATAKPHVKSTSAPAQEESKVEEKAQKLSVSESQKSVAKPYEEPVHEPQHHEPEQNHDSVHHKVDDADQHDIDGEMDSIPQHEQSIHEEEEPEHIYNDKDEQDIIAPPAHKEPSVHKEPSIIHDEPHQASVHKEASVHESHKEPSVHEVQKEASVQEAHKEASVHEVNKEQSVQEAHKEASVQQSHKEASVHEVHKEASVQDSHKEASVHEVQKQASVQQSQKEASVHEVHKEASVQDAHKEASVHEVQKEASVQDAHKEASVQEAKKEASVQEAHKEASVQEAKKEASVQEAHKEASVQEAKKESSVQDAHKEASVHEVHKEESVQQVHKEASVHEVQKEASVQEAKKEASLQESHKEASVQEVHKEASVQEAKKEASVQESHKEASVQEVHKEASVQEAQKEASVQEVHKEASVQQVHKEASVQEVQKEASVKEAHKEASAQEVHKEASVQEVHKEASVQEAKKEASVQEAAKEASVQEVQKEASVKSAKKEASVHEVNKEASTQEVHKEASVQGANKEPSTHSVQKEASVKEATKEASVKETTKEAHKEASANESPVKQASVHKEESKKEDE